MGTVLLRFLLGGLAGLLAWMLWEPSYPKAITGDDRVEGYMVLTAGVFIGGVIAGLSGYTQGGRHHTLRGLGLGALFGGIGIMFGYGIGSRIVGLAFPASVFTRSDVAEPVRMMARMLAILPTGALLGLAVGGATLNARRAVQGLIGGVIAGAISGFLFDPLASLLGNFVLTLQGQRTGETGTMSRAMTFLLLGASIGLFIGLVERLARSAWLRLQLGRNEGKEWSIDSSQTFIGRNESANVPLFGDPNVAPIHCSIQRQGRDYVLVDGGSPIGTYLNGQRIQSALLTSGSQIQVAGFVLQFLVKNQPAPARGPEAYVGQAYPMGGQPGQMPPPGYPQPQTPMPQAPVPTQMYPNPGAPMPGAPMPGMPMPGAPTQAMPGMMPGGMPTTAYGAGGVPSGFTLVAIDGPMVGQRFPVTGPVEIGREGSGVRMGHDANASRRHAVVQPGMGSVTVQDLGSTNGTFVNGQRVSQANAGPGDMIKIGSTTFRVEPG
ncbi:MAG: FHA domain-containing protein [Fimbriimonas sp.]